MSENGSSKWNFRFFFAIITFMKIIRAKIIGFCAGVRRAVECAEKAIKENDGGRVFTFGPLIHNPIALKKFEERNLRILEESEISTLKPEDTVVIRAHGVPPMTFEKLESTGAKIMDATCPLVRQSQKKAFTYAGRGYTIVIAGDKGHGELLGIEGAARKAAEEADSANSQFSFHVIKTLDEAKSLSEIISKDSKLVLMSQTTFSIKEFARIEEEYRSRFPEIEVVNSICPATHERQDALLELCSKVDGVIVIGGKTSANTNRLFTTAKKQLENAALIENADEIPDEFYSLETIGITAGASTPDDVIEQVESKLLNGYN